MNLKKTLFSTIAALALSASVLVPVALAGTSLDTGGSTTATVNVTVAGEFNAEFCGPVNLSAVTLTAGQDEISTGALEICYTDTIASRSGFKVQVQAGPFQSTGNPDLSASNFKLTTVYNPWQGQWGGNSGGADVADIGGWNGAEQVTDHGFDNPADANNHGALDYVGAASLDTARYIAYSWDGVGTGNGDLMPPSGISAFPDEYANVSSLGVVDGTYQVVEVELTVPRGTATGGYSSNLTLTIVAGEGYPSS